MDSLTQMTLGAAVAEAVAGKKLGNKAMLWGALAGTIPDLDVITNFWMNDIEAMAFHRGITHSIVFSIVCPFLFAMLARWYYKKANHQKRSFTISWQFLWIILGGALTIGTLTLFVYNLNLFTFVVFVLAGALGVFWVWRSFKRDYDDFEPLTFARWYLLFFLCFATHIMIDAFTTYGTQIYQPFSNFRFTTSTISVVDPMYTVPMLLAVIVASLYRRSQNQRRIWNNLGLIISSMYMVFTFFLKNHVDKKFEARISEFEEAPIQSMTNPTIFNSILWHGIAEYDTAYVEAYYSLFDKQRPFEVTRVLPKNRHLINKTDCEGSETLNTLTWFSDDYYNFTEQDGTIYYNDRRFGSVWLDDPVKSSQSVFYFELLDNCGAREIRDTEGLPDAMKILWDRIKGH